MGLRAPGAEGATCSPRGGHLTTWGSRGEGNLAIVNTKRYPYDVQRLGLLGGAIRLVGMAVFLFALEAGVAPAMAQTTGSNVSIALGLYQPALPNDFSGASVYEAAPRRPLSIVSWYALWGGWKSTFSRPVLDAVSAHGSLPLITWEPWAGECNRSCVVAA